MQTPDTTLLRIRLSKLVSRLVPLICFFYSISLVSVAGQGIGDSVELHYATWTIAKINGDSIVLKPVSNLSGGLQVVRYYAKDDTSLYDELRAGKIILDAVIEYFDWEKLSHSVDSVGVSFKVISAPIRISECYIYDESTGRPGEDLFSRNSSSVWLFDQPVEFYQTIFRTRVILTKSIFKKAFRFYMSSFDDHANLSNSTFMDSVEVTMSNFKGLALFENCTFQRYVNFSGTDFSSKSNLFLPSCDCEISFKNCVFKNEALFVKTDFDSNASFAKAVFEDVFVLGPEAAKGMKVRLVLYPKDANHFANVLSFKSATFKGRTFLAGNDFRHLILDSAYFNHSTYFNNSTFNALATSNASFRGKTSFFQCGFSSDVSFKTGCLFKDTLDVRGIRFDLDSKMPNVKFLSVAHLYNDLKLFVDDDIQKYHIALEDLERVWIVADSKAKVERVRLFNNAIRYVNGLANESTELRNRVLQRLEFQISLTDLEFSTGLENAWLWLVNLLTRNGYQGGGRFFTSVFVMITLFAIIYFFGFRKELEVFFLYGHYHKEPEYARNVHKNTKGISPFIRAYAFSVNVFINPKFEFKYFKFSPKLQQMVVVEWCLGVAMFILFLVFIASKYAFVQTLLGI